jgi:hypothetical protein
MGGFSFAHFSRSVILLSEVGSSRPIISGAARIVSAQYRPNFAKPF